MRVVCPACNAQYEVPNRLIGASRRLRCTRCNHDWLLQSPAPAEAPQPISVAAPPPAPGLRRQPQVPHPPLSRAGETGSGLLWLAWLGSLLAVGLLLAGLWLYRADLIAAWPPIARLYGWLAASAGMAAR